MQLWATGLLLAAATLGRPAVAAPDAERLKTAADEFDAGRRAYRLRDFENAAIHFENADRDVPSPEALESAIRARKEAGQEAKAATLSAWGLARYPGDKELADYAPKIIAEGEKALYKLTISCSPECALIVDEKVAPFGETVSATLYLDPGAHTLVAGWPNDRRTNSSVEATAGGAGTVSFSAPAAPSTSTTSAPIEAAPGNSNPPESDRGRGSGLPPAVFFVGAGATVILTGITVWSGIDTLNSPGKEAIARCLPRDTTCADYQLGVSHQNRTNLLIGATSVVAAGTAVLGLFFTNWSGGKANEASITPVLTAEHGIRVGAVGRF
jgi:hypothetical protein